MIRALYTAASGMIAQQLNLDNVANNLANASTAGFRGRRVQFEDMLYQNVVTPGAAQSQQTVGAGLQIGLGARSAATEVLMTQGDFNQTGNPLDLAITGNGFFQVKLPDGTLAYTRAGSFHLDGQGALVTADGDPVQPAITIPPDATAITIAQDGTVNVTQPGQQNAQQVGQLQLATFANPGGLNGVGHNLFLSTTSSGDAIVGVPGDSNGLGKIEQGSLENANVSVVEEFVQMVLAQRAYESNSRVVKAADDMYSTLNTMTR